MADWTAKVGWKRLAIAVSTTWMVIYFLFERAEIILWQRMAWATPMSTCTDVLDGYPVEQARCQMFSNDSFNAWWATEGPTINVLLWWLGPPLVILLAFWVVPWIREGFKPTPK